MKTNMVNYLKLFKCDRKLIVMVVQYLVKGVVFSFKGILRNINEDMRGWGCGLELG